MQRRAFLSAVAAAIGTTAGCIGTGSSAAPSSVTVDDGLVTATLWSAESRSGLRYVTADGEIAMARPSRERWLIAGLHIEYEGTGMLATDKVDDLVATVGGEQFEEVLDLPFPRSRERTDGFVHPEYELRRRGEKLFPGGPKPFQFLFDVPSGDAGFEWRWDGEWIDLSPKH